ncbi:MAG: hypothetical protein NFCOHLIN_02248 [Gammaproteobacteria bacterium]|nr:hypothetical protein [Gammaproteobacteria bacterium]
MNKEIFSWGVVMPRKKGREKATGQPGKQTENYSHPTASLLLRPEVGTQAQFRKKKPPKTYRFDSSLSPALDWDGQNPTREQGETLIRQILEAKDLGEAKAAAEKLRAFSKPFLNWAGKAERLSFDVPTLPLFIHERLSTRAILETLKGHKRDRQIDLFDLFGDRQHPIHEQVLRAYEHMNGWTNRMVLGDSLAAMNSLLHYEGMGGQVQMIYMDPPYGVKFGSNFQPFVRRRDVAHNDDEDMTREPEMVKAYRDTWELGLHSYLTYLRDRILLSRDLLAPSGSIFVQISDENVHHVREVMDEIFGAESFVSQISFKKTGGLDTGRLPTVCDYLLWYSKDPSRMKYRQLFFPRDQAPAGLAAFRYYFDSAGDVKTVSMGEQQHPDKVPKGIRLFQSMALYAQGASKNSDEVFEFKGRSYRVPHNKHWRFTMSGLQRLAELGRVFPVGDNVRAASFLDDFPVAYLNNVWTDSGAGSFTEEQSYVVQTTAKVIQRCMLMTTDPGDLVVDPTCGSGTTAYVAEQWGRRWITVDTSRVPLALARQRLLTATFPYYELKECDRGPAGGFVYKRRQNSKGEEVGGIVPHITLGSIANDEPPAEEVLVDRPETNDKITRVTGPFCVEATIPTPIDWEGDGVEDSGVATVAESHGSFVDRMLEVLRRSPALHIDGGKSATLRNVRPPAKTLTLSAEAIVEVAHIPGPISIDEALQVADEENSSTLPLSGRPVAIVFGPEGGAVSEKLVYEAAREAHAKHYDYLYVIGFAIQPDARKLIEKCEAAVGVPATYVQATPDLLMGDLLKNMRSSQIFSVCGLPEVKVSKVKTVADEPLCYAVKLLGLDVFDPVTMEVDQRKGDDVPAWFLDTDYNGLCFHVCQAFFPRTGAWDSLKRALKGEFQDSVWEHLAGSVSAPFEAGEHGQVAVKVIDDRGNELMVVKSLKEAR